MDFKDLPVPHDDGHFISDRVSRTVELIRQYDSNLDVVWLPPERRDNPNDPEFYVVERMADGRTLPVFSIQSAEFMDERLLERIYETDALKQDDVLSAMDARNKAKRDMIMAEARDRELEYLEVAKSVLKSPKSRYRHNGRVYE
jgi:hypothetical protein